MGKYTLRDEYDVLLKHSTRRHSADAVAVHPAVERTWNEHQNFVPPGWHPRR